MGVVLGSGVAAAALIKIFEIQCDEKAWSIMYSDVHFHATFNVSAELDASRE